jgi:hypothetical protein
LIEDGYDKRAETVQELVRVQEDIEGHPDAAPFSLRSRQFILKRRLLILPLCPGDLVTTDESGRYIPFIAADRTENMLPVGEVRRTNPDGTVVVMIRVANGYPVGSRDVLWR